MNNKAIFTFFLLFLSFRLTAQSDVLSWKSMSHVPLQRSSGKMEHVQGNAYTVFVMLSAECPLCKNYMPVLNELQRENPDILFCGIFPGKSYSLKEINDFQKEYQASFSLYIDPKKSLSNYLKASTTPECVLIDKMGAVIYRGLIDNWASGLGQKRRVVTEKYLQTAIRDLKAGKPTAVKQTKPIGCLINDL